MKETSSRKAINEVRNNQKVTPLIIFIVGISAYPIKKNFNGMNNSYNFITSFGVDGNADTSYK